MTADRHTRFDRVLPELFTELADPSTPDYLEAAIEHASSRPQRPAWTFPERWFPVQITTRAVPVPRFPWRPFALVAVLLALVVAAVVASVGSKPPLPPPFGPARNGELVFERQGDIVMADPVTGVVRPVITSAAEDGKPVFSPDGTRIAFVRRLAADLSHNAVMVANADGSAVIQATEPMAGLLSWTFSPDGRDLLVTTLDGGVTRLIVVTIDGSRSPRTLDVPLPGNPDTIEPSSYRPPDGREILVVTREPGAATRGISVVHATTGDLRTIVPPDAIADVHGAAWSPRGDLISYGRYIPAESITTRAYVIGADDTGARLVDPDAGTAFDHALAWSNDGTRMLILRGFAADESANRLAIVSVTGDRPTIELECGVAGSPACGDGWMWSPDDTVLLGQVTEAGAPKTVLADPATGELTHLDFVVSGLGSWQRMGG